jgi:uncharacterized protein YdgA (DUF945 family)
MKKILFAIAVLALLYPVVAWLMGVAIERRIEQLSDQEQSMLPQLRLIQRSQHGVLTSDEDASYEMGSTIKVTHHYHRGWFSSVDDVTLEMSSAALDALPAFRLLLRSVIQHGPFCGSKCFALAGAETLARFTGPLQASLPMTIRSRFAFFGGGMTTVSSPAFDHVQIGQDVHLSWGGVDGTMHYGARLNWYDLAASIPSLRLEGAKGTLQIDGMSFDAHSKRLLRTLYGGDSRIEIKRLTASDMVKGQDLSISNLVLASQNQAPDGFMSVVYQLGAGEIVTQPLTLSGAHVDLTWKHLGLDSLEALFAAMRDAGQQNDSVAPAARAQTMMAAIKQPLEALLLNQPEMDIDRMSAATAQGQGLITGVIRLVGASAADFEMPAMLLRKLDVRLEVAIDEAFLSNLPGAGANALTLLRPMIDQGYIARANGTLRTQILFREGQPSLNGKPFNRAASNAVRPPPQGLSPQGLSTPQSSSTPRTLSPATR